MTKQKEKSKNLQLKIKKRNWYELNFFSFCALPGRWEKRFKKVRKERDIKSAKRQGKKKR